MEEGGVWNSGMMWRNDGKMDGWHYANSLRIVKLRQLPDRHSPLKGAPHPTIDRNSHDADTDHPQTRSAGMPTVPSAILPRLFDPAWWQTHRQVVGSSIGRGVTWFVKDESRHLVLRHYYRGGMVGKLVRDRFWFPKGLSRAGPWPSTACWPP